VDLYRPRTRVGQFFVNAFRPLTHRGRRESTSSISSTELPPLPPKTVPVTIPSPSHKECRDILGDKAPFTRFVKRSRSNDALQVTESSPPISLLSLTRTKSSPRRKDLRLRRSFSAGQSSQLHSHPLSSPPTSSPPSYPSSPSRDYRHVGLPPPVPPKDMPPAIPSRWRFFPFITRDAHASLIEPGEPPISGLPSPPREGEVVCLSYNTLDDRGMRRLEGRSDHRPVIGSYAIYL
jgi:synaptojanin